MDDDALFPEPVAPAERGGCLDALDQAVHTAVHAQRYPAALALARACARSVDRADRRNQPAIVAQLAKSYLLVLTPLGLAPDPMSHPGDPAGTVAEGAAGGGPHPLTGYSTPTLVHSAPA